MVFYISTLPTTELPGWDVIGAVAAMISLEVYSTTCVPIVKCQ